MMKCVIRFLLVLILEGSSVRSTSWHPYLKVSGMASSRFGMCRYEQKENEVNITISLLKPSCAEEYHNAAIGQVVWKFYKLSKDNMEVGDREVFKTDRGTSTFTWRTNMNDVSLYAVIADISITGTFGTQKATITGYIVVDCGLSDNVKTDKDECHDVHANLKHIPEGPLNLHDLSDCSATSWSNKDACFRSPLKKAASIQGSVLDRGSDECSADTWHFDSVNNSCTPSECLNLNDPNNCFLSQAVCENACSGEKVPLQIRCSFNCDDEANPQEEVKLYLDCVECNSTVVTVTWRVFSCPDGPTSCEDDPEFVHIGGKVYTLDPSDEHIVNSTQFRVTATGRLLTDEVGSAAQLVKYSPEPVAGTCAVSPDIGYSLITDFNITCNGFLARNHSLTYTMTAIKNANNNKIYQVYSGPSSHVEGIKLANGRKKLDFMLEVEVKAALSNGAAVSFSTYVQVYRSGASPVQMSSADVVKGLIDVTNTGQDSTLATLVNNGDTDGAVQLMDDIMSTVNEDTGPETEERALIRTAVVDTLAGVVGNETSADEVSQIAGVLSKITQAPAELTEETQDVAAEVAQTLALSFDTQSSSVSSAEVVETTGLILSGVSQLLDVKTDTGQVQMENTTVSMSQKHNLKNSTERLLGVIDILSKTLITKQVLGTTSTNIYTDSLTLGVSKVDSAGLGSEELSIGLKTQNIPAGVKLSPAIDLGLQSEAGLQLVYMEKNPYVWDDSATSVKGPVVSIELKDDTSSPILVENLLQPITVIIPTKSDETSVEIENSTLVLNLVKEGNNVTFDFDQANILTFNFTIQPGQTTVLSIDTMTNISNLLLYITDKGKPTLDDIQLFGFKYPEMAYVHAKDFSSFNLSANIDWNELQDSKLIFFTYNNSALENATGEFNVGVSVDLNDNLTLGQLSGVAPECLGEGEGVACQARVEIHLHIHTHSLTCKYWNKHAQAWLHDGCEVSPQSSPSMLQCLCNHMTAFSGGVFVLPNFVDPIADAALFLTFFDNPIVVTTVIIVWILYFFVIHWARRADKQDQELAGVLLCGEENQHYLYLVCVVTGWWTSAGTTANVFFSLTGSEESSPKRRLTTSVRPCFQTGYEDWFIFTTKNSLGDLKELCLWHDNTGTSPHWYLSHVYIKDLQAGSSWTFIYKDWLAVDRGSLLHTSATVTATSQTELREKRQHNFMVKTSQDLRDGHLWISIFSKRARSTFTRVQRLTCALSLLLTTMLTNIMFYGVSTDDPSDQVGAAGGWVISLSAIVIGIESSLIMFPVNLLVLQLFLKLKSRPTEAEVRATSRRYKERAGFIDRLIDAGEEMAEQVTEKLSSMLHGFESTTGANATQSEALKFEDIPCTHVQSDVESAGHRGIPEIQVGSDSTLDMYESTISFLPTIQEVDETQADTVISSSMSPGDLGLADTELAKNPGSKTTFPKIRVTSESKNTGKFLPWWFLYVAWVLVVMISLVSSYFVMLYGLKYGYQRSVEWLVSFLTGFTQSAFLTQPLKVFAIAMVFTLLFKKTVEFDDFGPEITIDEDEKYVNGVCEPPEVHIPYNEPLSESLLKQIKDRIKLEWLMDMTLRDLLLYFVYLGVLLVVVHGHREVRTAYLNTLALEDVLVNPGCVKLHQCFFLEKADKVETFYQYLHEVAIPSLADMSEADHEFATPGSSHFLLGPWRIRQTRVTKDSCYSGAERIVERFGMRVDCSGEYWLGLEETGDYNSSWAHRLPKGSGAGTWWGYQSAWQLKTLPITGSLATYYGGGYVITMPTDTTLHAGIVEEMWNSDWLDEHTRAVMIEFTMYNPNADLFSPMVLLFEFSRSGAILPSHQFFSTNLFHYSTDFATFVAVCEVMFLCFNISFTYFEWKKLKVLGRKAYFKDFWNYIELLQMGLSYSVVGLFFQRMLSVSSALEEYGARGGTTYISFTTAIFWNSVLNYVMAFLVGLVTLKSIKLLQFNKRTFMIFDTLNHTKAMIGSFIMMAVLFTVAFASLGVLAFGTVQHGYREMFTSLMTVFNFALGVSDLPGLQGTNRILGPAFFVSFVFLVQFCFMTIFVAILNFGISESKALFEKRKNKFELLEYVLLKIKSIADSN